MITLSWYFWPIMIGVYMLLRAVSWLNARADEMSDVPPDPEPDPVPIKFFGGPLDAEEHKVPDPSTYYVAPYLPDDDDERTQIGMVNGIAIYAPNFAFYQQIDPNSYFYVRDINEEEIMTLKETGELPPVTE